jgi:hypothetical protein
MDLTRDEHTVRVGDVTVSVTGTSGPISATWRLLLDDREVARQEMLDGDHVLAGALPDGSRLEAHVHQSIVGPTRVSVRHDGVEILATSGFVA